MGTILHDPSDRANGEDDVVIEAPGLGVGCDVDTSGPEVFSVVQRLARALHVPSGELQPTLEAIVQSAVGTVPGTDDAGLILVRRGDLEPIATTGRRPAILDEMQRRLREGPCFDSAGEQKPVIVTDLQHDVRWPSLTQAAAELGVVSMACVPLWVETRITGALSLYSRTAGAFDAADLDWVDLFATHAALALADAQRADQLRAAMASRDLLGQAKGILMERMHIGADAAFALLTRASQNANVKLTAVAEHLVHTGDLLGPRERPRS